MGKGVRRWSSDGSLYRCSDFVEVRMRARTVYYYLAYGDTPRTVKSGVFHRARTLLGEEESWISVSGVLMSRDMRQVVRGSRDLRTLVLPKNARSIFSGAFYGQTGLRAVVLNEGLECIGGELVRSRHVHDLGAFQETGLRRVKIPASVRFVQSQAFSCCPRLFGEK